MKFSHGEIFSEIFI